MSALDITSLPVTLRRVAGFVIQTDSRAKGGEAQALPPFSFLLKGARIQIQAGDRDDLDVRVFGAQGVDEL